MNAAVPRTAQEGSDRDHTADAQSDGQSGGGSSQSGDPSAAMRTFDGFILWYKEKVQQLAPLLVQAQFDSSSRAGQQVEAIWHEVVRLCRVRLGIGAIVKFRLELGLGSGRQRLRSSLKDSGCRATVHPRS